MVAVCLRAAWAEWTCKKSLSRVESGPRPRRFRLEVQKACFRLEVQKSVKLRTSRKRYRICHKQSVSLTTLVEGSRCALCIP